MDKIHEYYYQIKNIEYIQKTYGKEAYVQVAGNTVLNQSQAGFWCALVNIDDLEIVKSHHGWDIPKGTNSPCFEICNNEVTYVWNTLGEPYIEHIVNQRDFYEIKPAYSELVDEFVLLNNLYLDKNTDIYYCIKNNGICEEVAKVTDNTNVFIKLKYLIKYATAKQMALLLFFDIRTKLNGTFKENKLNKFCENYNEDNLVYSIWGDENTFSNHLFSVLMGKKIILPKSIEECGYWPYDKKNDYEEFIIGINEYGDNILYTSNPDKLSNYFGANEGAPHYLTPIFFKKEVLQKYYSHNDIYTIEDSRLSCKSLWSLSIDNHHNDVVSVYLGDLGRDLPIEEQPHWKSYNIVYDKGISKVQFKRDFCCIPTNPEIADLKFKTDFSYFQKQWHNKFGWYLFLPLTSDDEYNFNNIHIPIVNTQDEFDNLVLSLVKTIIDSINEKELKNLLKDTSDKKSGKELKGSISILERWFEEKKLIGYTTHIEFLRNLQNLRSSGTGHRKGSNYDKISKEFNLNAESYINVFDSILEKTNIFLSYLNNTFLA